MSFERVGSIRKKIGVDRRQSDGVILIKQASGHTFLPSERQKVFEEANSVCCFRFMFEDGARTGKDQNPQAVDLRFNDGAYQG